MILSRIFSSYTFRYCISAVTALSVAVFIFLVFIYASFSYDFFHDVHDAIRDELNEFELQVLNDSSVDAVNAFVAARHAQRSYNRYYYLLVDSNLNKVAGDLDAWPHFKEYGDGWLSFELDVFQWDGSAVDSEFVARSKQLPNGYQLLVARYYQDMVEYVKLVAGMLIRGMLTTIVLGTFGAIYISLSTQRRLDSVSRSIHAIMSGDLSRRIPTYQRNDDLTRLITHINHMLDRIQALMESMKQVTDNIAHDLRTPLTRLRNHLTDLQGDCEEANREAVEQLIGEADELLATFNALLRIARIESGDRRAGFAPLQLRVILEDVIELYEPLAVEKDLRLSARLVEADIDGDRDLLFQAFANVIDNAIKYTPSGGSISIGVDIAQGVVTVSIADNGPGVSSEDRYKVFRRFFRVEASRGMHPGNGLGLSLVLAVIKLHQGSVTLGDNEPGLLVTVRLPLKQTQLPLQDPTVY